MERRRVVITGLGAVTPIGLTAAESWQAGKDGVCGIAPITQFDPTDLKVHLAAEVKGFVPENYMSKPEAKRMGRFTQMAVVSAKEALDGAGFTLDEAEADRCGVIVSSGIGGLSITEAEHDKGKEKGWDRVSPFYIPTGICNMAAGQIAIHTGFRGMCSCPVTACTGGTNAVGDAFHYIRDGYADVMLCGGTESAVTPLAIGAFTSMKALTQNPDPKRASIPFDAERSGFVLGEGAAILLLEELEHQLAESDADLKLLNDQLTLCRTGSDQFRQFAGLEVPVDQLEQCRFVQVRFGCMPQRGLEMLQRDYSKDCQLFLPCGQNQQGCWGVCLAPMVEAARIDGAGFFQQFWYITLPNIKGSLALCALLRTIDTFRLFEKVNVLTGGGPAGTTTTITQFLYTYGIKSLDFGFGSAGAIVMTLLVLILSSFYIKRAMG